MTLHEGKIFHEQKSLRERDFSHPVGWAEDGVGVPVADLRCQVGLPTAPTKVVLIKKTVVYLLPKDFLRFLLTSQVIVRGGRFQRGTSSKQILQETWKRLSKVAS